MWMTWKQVVFFSRIHEECKKCITLVKNILLKINDQIKKQIVTVFKYVFCQSNIVLSKMLRESLEYCFTFFLSIEWYCLFMPLVLSSFPL